MGLFSSKPSGNGYGAADKKLAAALRGAKSQKEADQIARADGHKDANAARGWLRGRS
jgi:hypothetical protein